MPKTANEILHAKAATQLTDGDVTGKIMVQNRSGYSVLLQATSDVVAPADWGGAIEVQPYKVFNEALADVFHGINTPVRLWAYSELGGTASVQHG